MRKEHILSLSLIACIVCPYLFTSGAVVSWVGGDEDSSWGNTNNWQGGVVPDSRDDVVVFGTGSETPSLVTLDRDRVINALEVNTDKIALDLNGFTLTSSTTNITHNYIGKATGSLGEMWLEGGVFEVEDTIARKYFYIGSGSGSLGRLILRGAGTTLRMGMQTQVGSGATGSKGVLRLESGSTATARSMFVGGDNSDGSTGAVEICGGTLNNSDIYFGHRVGGRGEMLISGEGSVLQKNSGNPTLFLGSKGEGVLTIENQAKVRNGVANLAVGANPGSVGTVTISGAGSVLGGTPDEGGGLFNVALGGGVSSNLPEIPGPGGIGTLNILDGGLLRGYRASWVSYFYVAPGSRIRIRDGAIKWCIETGKNRDSPFYFSPASFYEVHLTPGTAAFSAVDSLIHSGANAAGENRINHIADANLIVKIENGFYPAVGSIYHIFKYDGELSGEFSSMPNQSEFHRDGVRLRIDYGNGVNPAVANCVTLEVLPQSGTLTILR